MSKSMTRATVYLAVLVAGTQPSVMLGAEINALITIGVQSAVEDLGPKFEKHGGEKLAITYGLSAALSKRVRAGFDPQGVLNAGRMWAGV